MPDEEARLVGERPIDPATYEAYLRGMHLVQKGSPQEITDGLALLHQVTDDNPADALAWAGLALGYSAVGHGPNPTPDVWTRARAAAERAVSLDPTLAEAWSALADVRFYADWDWEGAEAAFHRANELNPSIAMNHFHYAWLLLVLDRYEEAVAEHELAKTLDPFTPFQSALLGWCYLYAGDTERAQAQAQRTLELRPEGATGLLVLGAAPLSGLPGPWEDPPGVLSGLQRPGRGDAETEDQRHGSSRRGQRIEAEDRRTGGTGSAGRPSR
ncbi:MAG: tetratricopeptide repeat protein [Gemmatimonadota bacterium]